MTRSDYFKDDPVGPVTSLSRASLTMMTDQTGAAISRTASHSQTGRLR